MKKSDRFDGFTVNVFLDEDGEYLAHFVELPTVSAFGESPEEALTELATAWEGVKGKLQKARQKGSSGTGAKEIQRPIQRENRPAAAPCLGH